MTIVRRLSDGTLWTPAGDCQFPLFGFNFVMVQKVKFMHFFKRWRKDMDQRWCFYDGSLFEIVK